MDRERRLLVAWAGTLLLLGLLRLGGAPLFDVDEGAFSEATREMLVSGDWGHTMLNGEPRWDKPILTYWLQAVSVGLFGLNEFALRLPSVLATWGWALALAGFARPRWGLAAALLAGTVVATSAGVLLIGRAATADALLNLWVTLAALDLWRHVQASGPGPSRAALRRAALWVGLGLLTKGPVALLVPGAAIGLFIAFERTGPTGRIERLRALTGDAAAWALLLLVAAPWYLYALDRHGQAFITGFLVRHNLQRYGGTLEGHGGSLGYYLIVTPLLMLPWGPALGWVLSRLGHFWREPLGRYLLLWAGFVLLFFSLSGTKLPHYALYGLSPLALLSAHLLSRQGEKDMPTGWRRAQEVACVLWPVVLAGGTVAAPWLASAWPPGPHRALLMEPARLDGLLGAALLAASVAAAVLWVPQGSMPWAARIGTAAGAGALLVHAVLAPWWGERLQGPIQRLASVARSDPSQPGVVQWGLHQPSLAVYLQRETPRRAPRPGELALVRTDQLDGLAGTGRWTLRHEEPGFRLIHWDGP